MPPKKQKDSLFEESKNFKHHLEEIAAILEWFDSQEALDVEQALVKIQRAAELIKASKKRLVEVENQFKEIKAEIEEDDEVK